MFDVLVVADDVLKCAKRIGLRLSPLQLMKLVYIIHGWHLALTGQPLIKQRIEAWKYGPVIPVLYHSTKVFGRDPIPSDRVADTSPRIPEVSTLVDSVVKQYGNFSGIALSNLTHQKGTPWSSVYRDGAQNIEIPNDLIRSHYEKLLNERRSAAATS